MTLSGGLTLGLVALLLCVPLESRAAFEDALRGARWKANDAVASSGFRDADSSGKIDDLKLEIRSETSPGDPWKSSCTVTDKSRGDRAVTLALCIPLNARSLTWWDDPQRSRPVSGKEPFLNQVDVGVGATGMASRYPLAVVSKGDRALCIALPVEPPRMARFVLDPARRELRAEFDFGLSPIPSHFPSCADATVIAFEVPAKWAFRRALQRYYELFPEAFTRRAKRAGLWLPFQSVEDIEKPEDFGFVFHEIGLENADFARQDAKLGIDAYVYTEPQTNWRELRGEGERGYKSFVSQLWEDALKGDERAQATLTSGIECADGRYDLYLGPVSFATAAPFGVNCDPDVPTEDWGTWPSKAEVEMKQLFAAIDKPDSHIEGIYVDSMEGWGMICNYNRDHWRTTRYPLTFDVQSRRVCLMNFWGTYAFVKEISSRLHQRDLLLMGNDAYFRFWFLAPHVDISGREYGWIENGKWSPVPDERFLFFRSMSGPKPYLILMNNDFTDGSFMEEYIQRCLFYAVFPSALHGHTKVGETAYFTNPRWYNRDRHLFVKYLPMIRKLDTAGWRPIPFADVSPESVRIERYGSFDRGDLAFSVHNPSARSATVKIRLYRADLGLPRELTAREWISDRVVSVKPGENETVLTFDMPANGYAVIGIAR